METLNPIACGVYIRFSACLESPRSRNLLSGNRHHLRREPTPPGGRCAGCLRTPSPAGKRGNTTRPARARCTRPPKRLRSKAGRPQARHGTCAAPKIIRLGLLVAVIARPPSVHRPSGARCPVAAIIAALAGPDAPAHAMGRTCPPLGSPANKSGIWPRSTRLPLAPCGPVCALTTATAATGRRPALPLFGRHPAGTSRARSVRDVSSPTQWALRAPLVFLLRPPLWRARIRRRA